MAPFWSLKRLNAGSLADVLTEFVKAEVEVVWAVFPSGP